MIEPAIQKTEMDWGIRLSARPLPDAKYAMLEMSADITRAAEPTVRYRFSAVPAMSPLTKSGMNVWSQYLSALIRMANQTASKMKSKTNPKK